MNNLLRMQDNPKTHTLSPSTHQATSPTSYVDNATAVKRPEQPDRSVLMVLSLILSRSDFTPSINSAAMQCMAEISGTSVSKWGLYASDRFTPTLVQIEYYSILGEGSSGDFGRSIDGYIRAGDLTACVERKKVGLGTGAQFLEGRTVIAPASSTIVSAVGNTPGWAVGAAVAGVGIVAAVALVAVSLKGEHVYRQEEYNAVGDVGREEGAGVGGGGTEVWRDEGMEGELRSIAGQREDRLVVRV